MFMLTDKVAILTGGSSGIGRRFRSNGAAVRTTSPVDPPSG